MEGILDRIEKKGVRLSINSDKLRIKGDVSSLSPEQIDYLKNHKAELMEQIKERDQAAPAEEPFPSYLEALAVRISTLESECEFSPTADRLRYIDRLRAEQDRTLAEHRDYWSPGPGDVVLVSNGDGIFHPISMVHGKVRKTRFILPERG